MNRTGYRPSPPHKEGCLSYVDCQCFCDPVPSDYVQTTEALIQCERERFARIIYRTLRMVDNGEIRCALEMIASAVQDKTDNGF